MGDPHNPARAKDIWDAKRIRAQEVTIRRFKDLFTVSGGWAWHFMSPPGHTEYKTQHDHKDIDAFISPGSFTDFLDRAVKFDFVRTDTLHDDPEGNFYRYVKQDPSGKIVIDLYLLEVPFRELDGIRFVEPKQLLEFYETTHSSKECWAVKAATQLMADGVDPVGHPALVRGGTRWSP